MDKLNKELRGKAVELGLCKQWQGDWISTKTPTELIRMYKSGLDFCIKHNYPSTEFIKEHFDINLLHKHGIYCDDEVDISKAESGTFIFNGRCKGRVNFNDYEVVTMSLRHSTELDVCAGKLSRIFIHLYDGAKVDLSQYGGARVYVYRHSEHATVNLCGIASPDLVTVKNGIAVTPHLTET